MAERFVGIDVALREHRIAVLDRDGEAVGSSFTIAASQDGVATLLRTLAARDATAAQTVIGLEASGHLWENLEAALVGAGYRVLVLNPLQTRRYRDVLRRKAKTDDIDAIAATYLDRLRLGLGSPFRLIDYALADRMLSDSVRRRVAYAMLDRTLDGDTYHAPASAMVMTGKSVPQ